MSRSSRSSRRQPALRDALDIASSAGSALWADGFERARQRRAEQRETMRAWADRSRLSLIEDRRSSHPDGPWRSPRLIDRPRTRFVPVISGPGRVPRDWSVPSRIGFREPSRVVLCVRRHVRREVMFALKRTSKGGRGGRPHRYTPYSSVRC